jgi:hypothetical protein
MVLAIVKTILLKTNEPLPKINYNNEKLIQLISRNNLNAFIAAHIDRFPELERLKQAIVKRARKSLAKNLLLQADLIRIIDLAKEHNIHLVLFKGHPVNEMIYGNSNVRTSTDVDICVPPSQLLLMEKILLEKDYTEDSRNLQLNDKEFELFLKNDNEKGYYSPTKSKVDVHFKLFKNPYILQIPAEENAYLIPSVYCNRAIYRMNNAYTLLYLVSHGKIHYWEKMMWLIDIVYLLRKFNEKELEEVIELAKKNNLEKVLLGTISLCNIAFEMPIPKVFEEKINNKQATYVIDGLKSMATGKTSKLSQWKQRVFFKNNFKFFLYQISLFPSRDMNIVKIPFARRILYPILRPITYLMS